MNRHSRMSSRLFICLFTIFHSIQRLSSYLSIHHISLYTTIWWIDILDRAGYDWLIVLDILKSLLARWFATGWRRPIGCLKLQVIFHKRATNYRALFWNVSKSQLARWLATMIHIHTCWIVALPPTLLSLTLAHTCTLSLSHTRTHTLSHTHAHTVLDCTSSAHSFLSHTRTLSHTQTRAHTVSLTHAHTVLDRSSSAHSPLSHTRTHAKTLSLTNTRTQSLSHTRIHCVGS